MSKRPAFQFYPGDWRRDLGLQSCSLVARGMWIEMLCLMHDGYPYGYLRVGDEVNHKVILLPELCRMIGCIEDDGQYYIDELVCAGVVSIADDGAYYSRRMVRDEVLRNKRYESGKLGGNPKLLGKKKVKHVVNHQDKQMVADASADADNLNTKNKVIHYPADFMQFWELYPNRKSKEDALKAWDHDLSDEERASMKEWTSSYVESRKASERSGAFVPTLPLPATYLRQKRWEDEFAIKEHVEQINPDNQKYLDLYK